MFQPASEDPSGEFGKFQEAVASSGIGQGNGELDDGDVADVGGQDARAFNTARQAVHGPVDLFVDLDEGEIGVGAEGEVEEKDGGFVAGAGTDVGQPVDLQ